MSEKVKGSRSSFNKLINDLHVGKSGYNKDFKYVCKALIVDIISGNKTNTRFLPNEEFKNGGIYLICGVSILKKVVAIQLRGMSYDIFRQNYGSDWNIIGRIVNVETDGYDEHSIRKGSVSFLPPYEGNVYENEDANIPVSYGGVLGFSSRFEDRSFNVQEPSNGSGEVWSALL